MTIENKNHWYDGLFYDKFIAPNQDKSYRIIKKIISRFLMWAAVRADWNFSLLIIAVKLTVSIFPKKT